MNPGLHKNKDLFVTDAGEAEGLQNISRTPVLRSSGLRFAIVTPTYPRHFEQNVRWLLSLIKNCRGCDQIMIQFVTSQEGDAPAMFDLLRQHPAIGMHANITLCVLPSHRYYTPNPIPKVPPLQISIVPLRTAYTFMKEPVEQSLHRTRRNLKWFGKYTHLSIKKYAGAAYAFGIQGIDVVWWLDSEAYLWRPDFDVQGMLEREWSRPRLYWSQETHYKWNSEVHELCPKNGTLPVHEVFKSRRPHLFSYSFYLIGKELFNEWTQYVEKTWNRTFTDIFLRLGQRESGYVFHIIETQLIVFVGGCQALNPVPEPCNRYQLIEVNSALRALINPEQLYKEYMGEMRFQGQFEHMFRLYLQPKYRNAIQRVVAFYDLPSFRMDIQYANCSLLRTVLEDIVFRRFGSAPMALQTNSDGTVGALLRNLECQKTLPIKCGRDLWNETCELQLTK
eukprot:CAMPEP_0114486812 /NCGR_PEP_ID=MMETSP0109-20121206/421_1 /TAXON_ID=29199 /ORGANISM="Chlorarachnion reptans, Strain CCCM449" /LENGTH=448 /DNA_ID=CAMNT_0001663013 /DNA_START=144 /DNA_END=1490 /DNA_ORIENTATION=-